MNEANPYEPPLSYEVRRPRYTLDPRFLPIMAIIAAIYLIPAAIAIAVEFTIGPHATDHLLSLSVIATNTIVAVSISILLYRWAVRRLTTV